MYGCVWKFGVWRGPLDSCTWLFYPQSLLFPSQRKGLIIGPGSQEARLLGLRLKAGPLWRLVFHPKWVALRLGGWSGGVEWGQQLLVWETLKFTSLFKFSLVLTCAKHFLRKHPQWRRTSAVERASICLILFYLQRNQSQYVYVYLIHFVIKQKLTHHCKSIILQ